jgi:hypothetical protein
MVRDVPKQHTCASTLRRRIKMLHQSIARHKKSICEHGVNPHFSTLVSSHVALNPDQIPAPYSASPRLGGAGFASEEKVEVRCEALAVTHDLMWSRVKKD